MNLNHRNNLRNISEEFRLSCRRVSQEFLRAGELSENKCENFHFFSAVKLYVDITVGFFPECALWCSLKSNRKELEYCVMNVQVGRGGFRPVAANSQTTDSFFKNKYHIQQNILQLVCMRHEHTVTRNEDPFWFLWQGELQHS